MRQRCSNPHNVKWKYYGARGITVCDRWNSYQNFLADMGERPPGMTIDRVNVNGNYEPTNCRWVDALEQSRNRRNAHHLEGCRFGSWTVVERAGKRGKGSNWLVRCDCGTEREVQGGEMLRGKSTSCGCSRKPKNKEAA